MRIGIDASNLRRGGGITHLRELLAAADPAAAGVSDVVVWGAKSLLETVSPREWLTISPQPELDRGLLSRTLWQWRRLPALARQSRIDVLFAPGGSVYGDFSPVVTMSRNLLPFEGRERRRYGLSRLGMKLGLLRVAQARSIRRADGVIFLSRYARDVIEHAVAVMRGRTAIIPHGVSDRFVEAPRAQLAPSQFGPDRPMRLIYVSIIDLYKHQWNVVEAVATLRAEGVPVTVTLAGPAYEPALRRLEATIERWDPGRNFVRYLGSVPYDTLHQEYHTADVCVFASSCENMPNILLEGMAAGLPIACSSRGPMPEILGGGGVFFDPEQPDDIARALRHMFESRELRERSASESFARARQLSWNRCAGDTLQFLAKVAREGRVGRRSSANVRTIDGAPQTEPAGTAQLSQARVAPGATLALVASHMNDCDL